MSNLLPRPATCKPQSQCFSLKEVFNAIQGEQNTLDRMLKGGVGAYHDQDPERIEVEARRETVSEALRVLTDMEKSGARAVLYPLPEEGKETDLVGDLLAKRATGAKLRVFIPKV